MFHLSSKSSLKFLQKNAKMNFKNLLLFCCLLFTIEALAQAPGVMHLPFQMSDKRQGKKYQEDLTFWAYPFRGAEVDLRDFKKRVPEFQGPDMLSIVTPDLAPFENPTLLLGLIKGFKNDVDALVIMLAMNYEREKVTFFIDKTLDRNFIDGVEIKQLSAKNKPYEVTLYPEKGNISPQKIWLKVPKPVETASATNRRIQAKTKIIDQFAVGIHLGIGVGKLDYIFDNLEKGFPTWYDVDYVEKNVGLSVSYNTRRFRFEVNSTYQSLFYYTSYLRTRFAERQFISPGYIRENIETLTNQDRHSSVRQFNYGATLGLRFHLAEAIEIQPFISYGRIHYGSGEYQKNRFDSEAVYNLSPSSFLEGGLRFEFMINQANGLFLDVIYHRNTWRPEGYFESFQYENLDLNNRVWKGNIGYRIGF